ncbi:MAG: xylulokinase [Gammaproteobacteria bacterium]|nr:xylulokinase [Gammaproteobacteria bacterium]MCH9744767.1 xylulokinase [Gammaproteobacteria bacterium]
MYIGIDLGTSSVKVLLLDEDQKVICSVSETLTVSRPQPLWSEQDPQHWWRATQSAMHALKKQHPKSMPQVKAIGLSGQMHGATLLDKQGNVLRPAILWNDGRSSKQCEQLLERVDNATQIVGNIIMPGFTAPKLLWVQQHEPEIFKQIATVLLPKDYLRYCMSGDYATDLSDASGTAWLNVAERCWSDEMLQATGLTEAHMPELFEGNQITGTLLETIASDWGMSPDVKLVAGGGDNAASAISVNVIATGSAFLSLGTSGVYFISDDQYRPNPKSAIHTMCHCLPNRWHEMNVHLSAACCLQWLSNILNRTESELIELSQQSHPNNTPLFLPYLSGERTPHNNPFARGVFFNMNHDTGPAELAQAVLEGVAFAIAEGQQALQAAGIDLNEVSVVGGGARSTTWGRILASALKRPLVYRKQADMGGALGSARLAWLAMNGGNPEQAFTAPPIDHTIEPDSELATRYESRLEQFKQLYQSVKLQFERLDTDAELDGHQ